MSSKSQSPEPALMGRRDALKLAAGAGACAVGLSGAGLPDDLDPALEAQALPFTGGTTAVNIAAAETAGIVNAVTAWIEGSDDEYDEQDVLSEENYQVGSSIADAHGPQMDEIKNQGADPYRNAAWQAIRTAAVREIVNGGSQTDAEFAADDALNKQTTRALTNLVVQSNAVIKAIADEVIADYNNSVGAIYPVEEGEGDQSWDDQSYTYVDQIEGPYGVVLIVDNIMSNYDWDVKPTDLEDFEEPDGWTNPNAPVTMFGFKAYNHDSNYDIIVPDHQTRWIRTNNTDSPERTVWDHTFVQTIQSIDDAFNNISSDLSTYVENLYNAIHEGAIDPSRVLGPQDIVAEFADNDDQSRLTAELLAVGADVPRDAGFQAKISHPELASDSMWGWLYPQFADGATKEISAGSTLASSDYEMAYFGYESEVDGSFQTRILSGSSDLQILDLSGLPDEQDIEVLEDETAGDSGRVTVWKGTEENAPDPIRFPSDHSDWVVKIVGAMNSDSVLVGNLETTTTDDGGIEYYAASTSLAAGELIEHKAIVPSSTYDQPVEPVSDPTTVTEEEIQERVDRINDRIDKIEEMNDSSTGGGGDWVPDIQWPSVGPIDTAGEWILATGGAIVGSIVLGNFN